MMRRKSPAFVGGALLVLAGVALMFGRSETRRASEPTVVAAATNGTSRILAPQIATAQPAGAPSVPVAQTPTARGTLPYVLTSATVIDKPLRLAAEALGAKTISSVSRKSILIEATSETLTRLKADARFEDVVEFVPAEKIQPELAAFVEKGAKSVEVSIVSLDAADREAVVAALVQDGGEILKGCINEGDTIRAKIPSDCVAMLAARGEVRWMETFERPKLMNDLAVNESLMNVRAVWNPHGLTGRGQKISTSDSGIDTGDLVTLHRDLRSNVKDIQVVDGCYTNDVDGHGTHTAGSIVGDGTESTNNPSAYSDGPIRGTAYEANLYAWFCGGKDGYVYTPNTMAKLYLNDGVWPVSVHSASWGVRTPGQYTSACVDHDRFVWEHSEFLPVFSAGNEGRGSMTIGSPASAKNILTVGATQSSRSGHDGGWGNGDPKKTATFSSRGPCQDGRIKPDLAAPGVGILSTRSHGVDYKTYGVKDEFYAYDSGTSMSCPLTAGAVALVRQWLVEEKGFDGVTETSPGVTNRLPTAALMKAVIMGGAKDASVPNNDQGWGRVDLEETLFPPGGRAVKLIDRIPFAAGFVTNIVVETTNAAPLDVQLVWVDYPGSPSGSQSASRLVNDLDLTVEPYGDGEGALYYGNGGDEPDTLNNVESVRIATAAPGKYIITIDCKTVLHDYTEGGAAALYIRGAFDPAAEPEAPKCVRLEKLGEDFFGFDMALAAICEDDETVKILRPTRLWKSVTVPTNCTVVMEAAEPEVAPVVRCMRDAVLTVPTNVSAVFAGVAFTNVCAGFAVAGRLVVDDDATFERLSSVTVADGGLAAFTNVTVLGDAPTLSVAPNGEAVLNGFSVAGAPAQWTVAGSLVLAQSDLALDQSVTVAPSGNLTLQGGVTNLTKVTLENASKSSLTLAGALARSIDVVAPGASSVGSTFGSFTCDYPTAEAGAGHFVNILDEERELGGKAYSDDGSLRWAVVEAPPEAAGASVETTDGVKYYYGFKSAFRIATNGVSTLTLIRDATYDKAASLSYDMTLVATNGAVLTLLDAAQFSVGNGSALKLTNIVVRGGAKLLADCAFKVTGGELTLESGAVLSGLSNVFAFSGKPWGGAIAVTAGTVTMNSGSRIENCAAHAGAQGGGAIYVAGKTATANLFGGTITGCSAPAGGAVYAWGNSTGGSCINIAGDFEALDNTNGQKDDKFLKPSNIYLMGKATRFVLAAPLEGSVGVSGSTALNKKGANFVDASALSEAEVADSTGHFRNDVNAELVGTYDADNVQIVWDEVSVEPPTAPFTGANVWIRQSADKTYYYRDLNEALADLSWEAPTYVFNIMADILLTNDVEISKSIVLQRDESLGDNPTVWRSNEAMYRVLPGGSLILTNITLVGAAEYDSGYYLFDSFCGLVSVSGGTLTLGPGSVVGYVDGRTSRAANAVTVFGGGTLTMEEDSLIKESYNMYQDESDATGCGGGVLLDGATAYLRGGDIYNCQAYRAGALYVANKSTLYVGGSCVVTNNTDLSGENLNNITVSRNSQLVVDDAFTGAIGYNEGIAGDTNWFGTVTWDWPSVEALTNSAARFVHDKTGAHGVAVTNGVDKTTVLVWSDWITRAGKYVSPDGDVYRICLAPGQSVVVPSGFSVAPQKTADGRSVLALEGGVEGCWYTVYSTADLVQPFVAETSVQLKPGETFEYEINPSAGSKFYKVVAEEGIK